MNMNWGIKALPGIALVGLSLGLFACNPDDPNVLGGSPVVGTGKPCPPDTTGGMGGTTATGGGNGGATAGMGGSGGSTSASSGASSSSGGALTGTVLDERVVAYAEALRTASLKLTGKLPKLDEIEGIRTAANPKSVYETYIDAYMQSPRFAKLMIEHYRNTFRMGGAAAGQVPSRETAPTFAAKLVVEGSDYRQLFTATSGTCPTFDPATGMFTPADCPNGPAAAPTAGILTDAGLHFQYASAAGFRRTRFIQETFACHKMPAEWRPDPQPKGAGTYTSPWPFESIGDLSNGGRLAFQDTSSAICANCHTTMNHRSPLVAAYDDFGKYVEPTPDAMDGILTYSMTVPVENSPKAKFSDYLIPGEMTAWKFGKPAANLLEFGQRMAEDDEVARCSVVRTWNYAFSKGDAVYDLSDVPDSVIGPLVQQFKANGYNLRDIVRAVFVHDDFVRY